MKDTWKGMNEAQAAAIGMDEFLKLISSRSRRTLMRLNQNPKLKAFMETVREIKKTNPKKLIKTHLRDAVIIPEWVGLMFGVYNGKEYKKIEIGADKLGRRLGEFSHSTGRVLHSGPGVGATRGSKFVPLK